MKKIIFTIFVISVIFSSSSKAQEFAGPFDINQRLGRGVNMGNSFEAPSETNWGNPWQPKYFRIMHEMGFQHVRIPVRWEPAERSMAEPPYTIYPTFLNRMKQVVDTALKYQLHPIINMHHHDSLFADPLGQKERFLAQWAQIADFFKEYPDSLVFEILNEPHGNLTADLWNQFTVEALAIIRETNPQRTVLIGTPNWGGVSSVNDLTLPDDEHLILTVHYYNPFEFTHQGAEWVGDNADEWLGTEWYSTQAERDAVINDFQQVTLYAQEHDIPVHVGEFGAYSTADIDSRVRWTNFLARWFEQQGYSWAYWEFSAGFGVYNPSTQQILTPLVDALLSDPMSDPTGFNVTPLFEDDFSTGTGNWSLNTSDGAQASMGMEEGNLSIVITVPGSDIWNVQLVKNGFTLEKDVMYRVRFGVMSDESRTFQGYMGMNQSPWQSYSGYSSFTSTSQLDTLSFTFQMKAETVNTARLVFDLGTNDVDIAFSFIAVEKLTLNLNTPVYGFNVVKPIFYPNPAIDELFIESTTGFDEVEIFDTTGRSHLVSPIGNHTTVLSLSQISPGLYFIRFTGRNSLASAALVII